MRRLVGWGMLAALLVAAIVWGALRWRRLQAAADVTRFVPPDVEALLWIPRIDEVTRSLLQLTRGIQEAERLRNFLKPETGVDLGDEDGLRKAGIDPEAGLAVFSRGGMVHVLFAVEDSDRMLAALSTKFKNLGHPPVDVTPPTDAAPALHVVPGKDAPHAAFASQDGLLVVVYRERGTDPVQGVRDVLGTQGQATFFGSARFQAIEARLGKDGPLLYADGKPLFAPRPGEAPFGFIDTMALPAVAQGWLKAHLQAWVAGVGYVAARADLAPCAGRLRAALEMDTPAPLLPEALLKPTPPEGPAFGKLLPRDSVLLARVDLDLGLITDALRSLAKLSSLTNLGGALGLGQPAPDPVASALGVTVDKDLADRHVVDDLLAHLTGHVGVALVGMDKKATVADLGAVRDDPVRWLGAVSVVLGVELKDPSVFWDKWLVKKGLLEARGFAVTAPAHAKHRLLRFERNCAPPPPLKPGERPQEPKRCETFGAVLAGNVLLVMSGKDTQERVLKVLDGQEKDLRGLTKEPFAAHVLDGGAGSVASLYFSYDGLLKAIRNRNLPGGATRYLAQFFEMATTIEVKPTGAIGFEVLLTR